ncbi:hypothetical protein Tco_1386183 [Tanacetum coccineum]
MWSYIKNFLKNEKLGQVVEIVKSFTLNVIDVLTVSLKDLLVFSPKPSMHYLNITMINIVKVFRKDTVPESSSGVDDLYKFDEEALGLALEEEARQARAQQEWLQKCRGQVKLERWQGMARERAARSDKDGLLGVRVRCREVVMVRKSKMVTSSLLSVQLVVVAYKEVIEVLLRCWSDGA